MISSYARIPEFDCRGKDVTAPIVVKGPYRNAGKIIGLCVFALDGRGCAQQQGNTDAYNLAPIGDGR